jgi:Family of unknown function (DUF6506)
VLRDEPASTTQKSLTPEHQMPLLRFAFVVKANGYEPSIQRTVLDAPLFQTTVVGGSKTEDALAVAVDLAAGGVRLIELCGGLTVAEAAQIQRQVGSSVPIGVVTYTTDQEAKLTALFG